MEAKVDRAKAYELAEALDIVKETSPTKFDATVEFHATLFVDASKSDQQIRGTYTLPNSISTKAKTIAVVCEEAKQKEATEAGAQVVGGEEMIEKIEKGEVKFDILVSTPAFMPKLGKLGKVLGPKGLMPNPKAGTVTPDVGKAVKELLGGRSEFKMDPQGVVHAGIGKVSQSKDELTANIKSLVTSLEKARPAAVKGLYFKSVALSSTMGPGVKVDLKSL